MNRNKAYYELLNKLLEIELETLRVKFRPYKRKPLLSNIVVIEIENVRGDTQVLAYYRNDKKKKFQKFYTHTITITKKQLDSYEESIKYKMKKYGIEGLRNTIRHELIHAFVYEQFEDWSIIHNCNSDYSPIFLSCLFWSGTYSGHAYTLEFLHSDLYKQIEGVKTFDDVYILLMDYIYGLEDMTRDINNVLRASNRELKIEFSHLPPGIERRQYIKITSKNKQGDKMYINNISELVLGIGHLVTPQILKKNYINKFENMELAKVHSEIKSYSINNVLRQKVFVKGNYNPFLIKC